MIDPTGKMDPKVVEFDTDKCSVMFHGMGNGPVPGIKPKNGSGSENYLINVCTETNSLALLRYVYPFTHDQNSLLSSAQRLITPLLFFVGILIWR